MSTLIISISAMCCPAEGGPVEQVLRAAPGVADVTLDYSTRTARVTGIMSTLIISISAMCCPAEGGPVEQVLRAAPGVADVTLDYSTRTARVTGNRISGEALLEALLSIGMPGELVVTGARRIVLSVPEMDCPVEAGEIQKAFAAAGITLEALLSIGMPGELVVTGARRIVLSVPEMDCPVEAGEIQKAFAAAGITGADFNVITRTVTLSGDDDLEAAAVRAVESCGYTAKDPHRHALGRRRSRGRRSARRRILRLHGKGRSLGPQDDRKRADSLGALHQRPLRRLHVRGGRACERILARTHSP